MDKLVRYFLDWWWLCEWEGPGHCGLHRHWAGNPSIASYEKQASRQHSSVAPTLSCLSCFWSWNLISHTQNLTNDKNNLIATMHWTSSVLYMVLNINGAVIINFPSFFSLLQIWLPPEYKMYNSFQVLTFCPWDFPISVIQNKQKWSLGCTVVQAWHNCCYFENS